MSYVLLVYERMLMYWTRRMLASGAMYVFPEGSGEGMNLEVLRRGASGRPKCTVLG